MLKIIKALTLCTAISVLLSLSNAQTDSLATIQKPLKEKFGDEFYGGVSHVYGYRTLKERQGFFAQPLGIRENETALWTVSYELGYRVKMHENFLFEFGMEYNQIGMQFRTNEDTTFIGYERKKQGIVAPIRGVFQWGEDFKIQLGGGFAPRMFTASKYKTIVLNDFGQEEETIVKQTDGYNYFNVDVLLNVGFRWNMSHNFGLYFLPEFRYGLLDTYSKQQPYVQHNYGLFLRWGIHLLL